MPHIHELIDFVVVAYIVHDGKVLLVDHKKHNMWLPVGGHVELNENPEEALMQEIQEECGLEVEIIGERPAVVGPQTQSLITPLYMDIHNITDTHRHVSLVYFARALSVEAKLEEREHNAIRWFTRAELHDPTLTIRPHIRFYAEQALEKVGTLRK